MIPAGTFRANVQGTLPGGEVFSWGWWIERGGDPGTTAAVQAADILADPNFASFIGQCKTLCSSVTNYVALAVARYGAGGHVDDAVTVGLGALAGPGSPNFFHPNYVAFCITLRDGLPGASHRNRFYLPCNGINLQQQGTLALSVAQDLVTEAAAYYVAGTAVVLSPKLGSHRPVTTVTADTKLDTQRGRNDHTSMVRVSAS